MREFDLFSLFHILTTKIKWLVLGLVAGLLIFGGYSMFFVQKEYTSTALIYVSNLNADTDANYADSRNLAASEQLVKMVRTATTTQWALDQASASLNNEISASRLNSSASFASVSETSFLRISFTYPDPVMAQKACQALAETAKDAFIKTGERGNITIHQNAVAATQTGPNVTKNTLFGGLLGLALAVVIVSLQFMLNNTVMDKDDLQRGIDVPVLGEIPSFAPMAAKGGNNRE